MNPLHHKVQEMELKQVAGSASKWRRMRTTSPANSLHLLQGDGRKSIHNAALGMRCAGRRRCRAKRELAQSEWKSDAVPCG
jgi:hypothetical protein